MTYFQDVSSKKPAFFGRVVAEWLNDREMVLTEPFVYRDSNGDVWQVPESARINGASIPRYLWSLVGSPYVGPYRKPSVVHDYYCQSRCKPAADVHWMFYDACLTAGVPRIQASLMYLAISARGPLWDDDVPAH